jgi:hypothetical protein
MEDDLVAYWTSPELTCFMAMPQIDNAIQVLLTQ